MNNLGARKAGGTALHVASFAGELEIVKFLAGCDNVDVNIADKVSNQPA